MIFNSIQTKTQRSPISKLCRFILSQYNSSLTNSIFCFIFILSFTYSGQAQKNDTIYLKNGDRISGELKKFEYGLLTLSTDAMLTVYIEFDKINTIYSAKHFEMRTNSGYRHFGHLLKSNTPATLTIVTAKDTITKPLWDIVQITRIKQTFLQKIDGSVDVGLTYTKASDVLQYSANLQATYRTTNYSTRFNLSSILTDNGDVDNISRNNNAGVRVTKFLANKWFARASAQGQQNTELDLDLRLQAGFGGGYDFVRTHSVRLYGISGLVANHEKTVNSSISNNMEALFGAQCKWFQYRHPKIDITANSEFYPSLTISNRIRFEYDIAAKYEIIRDLFFNLQLYGSTDSKPTSGAIAKKDWGIITSIGFTF